jgi:cell division protein FtsX
MDQVQFILERIDAIDKKFDEKLDKILIQTTKTNGRVDGLEAWKKAIQKFVWFIAGIMGSILVLLIQNKMKL